jgi:molybdate transport system permease protein
MRNSASRSSIPKTFWFLGGVGLAFILLPILSLILKVSPSRFYEDLRAPETISALRISLESSIVIALLAFIFGVPVAFLISRAPVIFGRIVRPIIVSALVFPPTVAGLALTAFIGDEGIVGKYLGSVFGVYFSGSMAAVIIAGLFVGAPFLILIAEASFDQLEIRLEESAITEGATRWQVFRFISIPQVLGALIAGTTLTWARALGEFGATMTFAGSFPGKTFTPSMQIYADLKVNQGAAYSLSIFMLFISLGTLLLLQGRWLHILWKRGSRIG